MLPPMLYLWKFINMSQIMEKTLASLPKLLTQSFIGGKTGKPAGGQPPSQEVQHFMKFVHRARSKSHEASIVRAELSSIHQKLKQSDLISSSGLVKNSFTKIIFCHILGYDVSFAAIYAVNLAQQGQGYDKRLGYLLSCLLLHPQHDMVVLMMATLMRDLKSSNMSHNCVTLIAAGELVGSESIPIILPEVVKKLRHSHEFVREKAVHCLRRFYQRSPALLQPFLPQLNSLLASRDPGVLTAVTNIFLILCSENPARYVSLGGNFLHILDQINHRGFGTNYYYHMVPLPWLQVSLLKILGHLGSVDLQLSQAIVPLLQTLIERTKVTEPISLAVLVESVLTATRIHANEELLLLCSRCIGKLLSADASNAMKYQGLGLLISLSRVKTSYAAQHQVEVVECLMNEDPAIQVRTSHLLHAMANPANVKAVCSKLFEQISKTTDKLFVSDIVQMISDLTERLAVDIDWYLDTYLNLLEMDLNLQTRDLFIDMVLSKMEQTSRNSEDASSESLSRLTSSLLNILNKSESGQALILLSLQLIGVLVPVIKGHLSDTFLLSAEKLLSMKAPDSSQRMAGIIKPPGGRSKEVEDFQNEDLTNIQCCCLMTVSKLVLGGCLEVDLVKNWLQKNDFRGMGLRLGVRFCLDELEDLLQHPGDLSLRSQIMFHPEKSDLDLSLSFLDKLVVRDLLQQGGVHVPGYIRLSGQRARSQTASAADGGPGDVAEAEPSVARSLLENSKSSSSGSSKMSRSFTKVKNKWRDDEEGEDDQSLVAGSDDESKEKRQHEDLAQELFAGVNEFGISNLDMPANFPKKHNTKKHNVWADDDDDNDDDDNEHGIGSSLGLHPFGIYRKTKPQHWYDEDIQNDNLSFSLDDSAGFGFISSRSEKVLSPSSSPSSPSDSVMSSKQDTALYTQTLHQSYPGAGGQSRNQGQVPAASIYSEYFVDISSGEEHTSGIASSGNMSFSTIDALTDSEPDEAGS